MIQQPLPDEYRSLSPDDTDVRIADARKLLGEKLVVLGHHYQRDEIIRHADYTGDSFKLSRLAASRTEAEFIVFCGVHFMAESADVLSAEHQKVILPNLSAGCSMADMAEIHQVTECWEAITSVCPTGTVPITYINSAANLKAFVGRAGGTVCTSSNTPAAFRWGFQRGDRILFFPDEHLGRNTGVKLGVPLDQMPVWDPDADEMGGLTADQIRSAKVILWKGYCSVHGRFNVKQIQLARRAHPNVKVVVHPECRMEVVQAADFDGSTERIIQLISQSPPGSEWAVGTEINLVNRLQQQHPDKLVFCLDPIVCPCSTMYRIHPHYLLWALENLVRGRVVNQVKVPPEESHWARVALDRMLSIQ
jgi:quinolinate synthase